MLGALSQDFLVTVGVFALFSLIQDWSYNDKKLSQKVTNGVIFGLLASLCITMAFTYKNGIILDARNAVLAICGFFIGPMAAAIAASITSATRLYYGGVGAATGVAGIWISILCGIACRHMINRAARTPRIADIVIFASYSPAITLASFFLMPGADFRVVMTEFMPSLYFTNAVWTLVFGLILLQDTNRRKMIVHLAESERRAEEAAKAKSLFLAKMSHEIRTPINGVFGFTELLRKTKLDETQDYYLKQIHSAVSSMILLVDDILDFSKIEAGKMKIINTTFNIRSLLESCIDLIQPEAERKNLELQIVIGPNVPEYVICDELRLRQVIMNLLSNALKFTQTGYIRLTLHSTPIDEHSETLTITVADTGIGIPADKFSSIFEAFEQADSSTTRHFGGTGLGLSIALNLMNQMHGRISVENNREKDGTERGTVFILTLPVDVADEIIVERRAIRESEESKEVPAPPKDGTAKAHILVAEDIKMNQDLVRAQLEKGGYTFQIVSNGAQAVQAVRDGKFDMILMDIQMPEMSGIQATEIIRNDMNIGALDLPIVALTAHALPEQMRACLEVGMDDCLVKPVDARTLYKTIDSVLGIAPEDPFVTTNAQNRQKAKSDILLDAQQVDQFVGFIGQERMEALFGEFIANTEKIMTILEETGSMARGDLHTMTGLAGNFGLFRLAAYCRSLLDEQNAPDQDLHPGIDVIHILCKIYRESVEAFHAYTDSAHYQKRHISG